MDVRSLSAIKDILPSYATVKEKGTALKIALSVFVDAETQTSSEIVKSHFFEDFPPQNAPRQLHFNWIKWSLHGH